MPETFCIVDYSWIYSLFLSVTMYEIPLGGEGQKRVCEEANTSRVFMSKRPVRRGT